MKTMAELENQINHMSMLLVRLKDVLSDKEVIIPQESDLTKMSDVERCYWRQHWHNARLEHSIELLKAAEL